MLSFSGCASSLSLQEISPLLPCLQLGQGVLGSDPTACGQGTIWDTQSYPQLPVGPESLNKPPQVPRSLHRVQLPMAPRQGPANGILCPELDQTPPLGR